MLSGLEEAKVKHHSRYLTFFPIPRFIRPPEKPRKKGSGVGAFSLKVNIGRRLV